MTQLAYSNNNGFSTNNPKNSQKTMKNTLSAILIGAILAVTNFTLPASAADKDGKNVNTNVNTLSNQKESSPDNSSVTSTSRKSQQENYSKMKSCYVCGAHAADGTPTNFDGTPR